MGDAAAVPDLRDGRTVCDADPLCGSVRPGAAGAAAGPVRIRRPSQSLTLEQATALLAAAELSRPHYDVVDERNDLESLVTLMATTPYVIRENPSVDREER